jgi:lipoate-protein ligase A
MALDEAIVRRVVTGEAPPTLRFYGWARPAISLGYHQVPEEVLDLDTVRAHALTVVRRPTGGRAVLHGDDLTYSVSLPAATPWATSVTEAYRILSEALRQGFRRAGFDVSLARGHAGELRPGPLPCFASTARYELVWNGKKLVGSAQRRFRGGVLQQGSIPLRRGAVRPEELLPAGQRVTADSRWTTVEEMAGHPVDGAQLARSLAEGFAEQLGVEMRFAAPDPADLAAAHLLEEGR